MIELDVQLSSDKIPIIYHDFFVKAFLHDVSGYLSILLVTERHQSSAISQYCAFSQMVQPLFAESTVTVRCHAVQHLYFVFCNLSHMVHVAAKYAHNTEG